MKSTNEHISAIIEKLNDKSDKEIEKKPQPMSVQIREISSKQSKKIQNEVITITSEHSSPKDQFERKPQEKISPSNQSFEQP